MNANDRAVAAFGLKRLHDARVVEDEHGVRWYTLVDVEYEDVECVLQALTYHPEPAMPATKAKNPKPITRALALLNQLYVEHRAPNYREFAAIRAALEDADARTRLDPSKRKGFGARKPTKSARAKR